MKDNTKTKIPEGSKEYYIDFSDISKAQGGHFNLSHMLCVYCDRNVITEQQMRYLIEVLSSIVEPWSDFR